MQSSLLGEFSLALEAHDDVSLQILGSKASSLMNQKKVYVSVNLSALVAPIPTGMGVSVKPLALVAPHF